MTELNLEEWMDGRGRAGDGDGRDGKDDGWGKSNLGENALESPTANLTGWTFGSE